MAYLKAITHICVLFINSTIRKRETALKTTLLVPLLECKSSKILKRY